MARQIPVCGCLSNTFTPPSCSQTQSAALLLCSPEPVTQAQALETQGVIFIQNFPFLHKKSVLSVQGAHSTHCHPPLAQLLHPCTDTGIIPASRSFLCYLQTASAFICPTEGFQSHKQGHKTTLGVFTERQIEELGVGSQGSPPYPFDVGRVLLHGNFFHGALKAKEGFDVERG